MIRLKHYISFILLLLCFITMSAEGEKFVLVLDPGHGGRDTGCVGNIAKEKDIVLKVATLLKDMVEKEYGKDVKVVMTRSQDKFIELQKRADIANEAKGDLFISIHVNSVDRKSKGRKSVAGASVYTCGLHKSENNLHVAMRENGVIELEPDYTTRYQGFDPDSSESYIMFELSQNLHQKQSISFAEMAQKQLISTAGRQNKDVRQAGFWVLWSTAMPSVLVELDFICNPTQEKFLASKEGQQKCARALFNAFKEYYKKNYKD